MKSISYIYDYVVYELYYEYLLNKSKFKNHYIFTNSHTDIVMNDFLSYSKLLYDFDMIKNRYYDNKKQNKYNDNIDYDIKMKLKGITKNIIENNDSIDKNDFYKNFMEELKILFVMENI